MKTLISFLFVVLAHSIATTQANAEVLPHTILSANLGKLEGISQPLNEPCDIAIYAPGLTARGELTVDYTAGTHARPYGYMTEFPIGERWQVNQSDSVLEFTGWSQNLIITFDPATLKIKTVRIQSSAETCYIPAS